MLCTNLSTYYISKRQVFKYSQSPYKELIFLETAVTGDVRPQITFYQGARLKEVKILHVYLGEGSLRIGGVVGGHQT